MDEHDLPTRNELSTYGICQVLPGVWAWERGYVLHAKMQEMNYIRPLDEELIQA